MGGNAATANPKSNPDKVKFFPKAKSATHCRQCVNLCWLQSDSDDESTDSTETTETDMADVSALRAQITESMMEKAMITAARKNAEAVAQVFSSSSESEDSDATQWSATDHNHSEADLQTETKVEDSDQNLCSHQRNPHFRQQPHHSDLPP